MAIPRRKTVQIVGAAPSLADCPVIEGAEQWIFNASYKADPGRVPSRVFNLHVLPMIWALQPDAWAWYQRQTCPVYLLEPHPDVPTSVAFPLRRIMDRFASDQHNADAEAETCFGCTLDFLIAFALEEGFAHIDLVGIECRSEEEYRDQRATINYWIGMARGMGCTLTTTRSSGLAMVPAIYGYNFVTGAPLPPGQPVQRWAHGHPYSLWPPPIVTQTAPSLIQGAFEHP